MKIAVGLTLAVLATTLSSYAGPGRVDTTKRATRVSTAEKAVLPDTITLKRNEVLPDQRFEAETYPKTSALIGERQSPLEIKERDPKTIIQHEQKTYETIERKENAWGGKKSRYSTSEDAYRSKMAVRFQDKIGDASPVSRDLKPTIQKRTTFDRINRFVFRKNGEQEVNVTTAGSERPAADASASSNPGTEPGTDTPR